MSQVWSMAIIWHNWHSGEILSHLFARPNNVFCASYMHFKEAAKGGIRAATSLWHCKIQFQFSLTWLMYQKSKHLKHKEFETLTWSGAGCWHILHPFPLKNTADEYLNCNNIWKNTCMKLQKKKSHNKSQKSNTTNCAKILAKKTNSAETPGTHFYRWFTFDGLILKTHFEWVNEHCSLISQMSQHSSSSQKVSNNSVTQCKVRTYPWDTKFQRFKRWVAETVSQEATIIFDSEHIITCIVK
jgi:hypothetical protein